MHYIGTEWRDISAGQSSIIKSNSEVVQGPNGGTWKGRWGVYGFVLASWWRPDAQTSALINPGGASPIGRIWTIWAPRKLYLEQCLLKQSCWHRCKWQPGPIFGWPLTSGGSWQAQLGYLDPLEPQGAVTGQTLQNQSCWDRWEWQHRPIFWLSLRAKGESIIQIIQTWQCFEHHIICCTRTPMTKT